MKTPRFLVAACVSLALAFTFSCSSDSSDDPVPVPVQSSSSDGGEVSSSSVGGGSSSSGGGSSSSVGGSSSSDGGNSSSSSDVGGSSSSSDEVSSSSSAAELPSSSSAVPQRTLTINVEPAAGGTVSHLPTGTSHENGTSVSVTATAKLGYEFTGWSGAATGATNPVAITMDGNKELTASFALASWAFIDPRDGHIYKRVEIGGKFWMAQNLNFDAEGSKCGDSDSGELSDDPSKCADYGRLYNWEAAMSACPIGWHLPSDAEWDELIETVGTDAGTKLKAASGWNEEGNGTDDFGFSALPGGYGYSDGNFYGAGDNGLWWSSSEYEFVSDFAYLRSMDYDHEGARRNLDNKTSLYSVRCVQD